MVGIDEEVKLLREQESRKPKNDSRSATSRKRTRNAKRLEKSKKYAYYQKLYCRDKKKLVAKILDGESSDVKPPDM
ncbi:unnamed protein product, partial [Adineta ricciae]